MGIRKPSLSVTEARHLASVRSKASSQMGASDTINTMPPPEVADTEPVAAQPEIGSPAKTTETGEITTSGIRSDVPASDKAIRHKTLNTAQVAPKGTSRTIASAPALRSRQAAKPDTPPLLPLYKPRPDKIQVFLSAAVPAPGVSVTFDQLSRQYPPGKALQMILRKALDEYEYALECGTFQNLPERYQVDEEIQSKVIQTSRMISGAILAIARAHFDPLGLESTRAFGYKFATAALAAFFCEDNKRK